MDPTDVIAIAIATATGKALVCAHLYSGSYFDISMYIFQRTTF